MHAFNSNTKIIAELSLNIFVHLIFIYEGLIFQPLAKELLYHLDLAYLFLTFAHIILKSSGFVFY